jgi:YfiH family protein
MKDALGLLRSTLLARAGFAHAFPERAATDDELARALGIEPGRAIAQVRQVHGGDALEVSDERGANGREGDALVAREGLGTVAVGVRVADCVPILVADEASGSIAAIHAGWRGVTRGVIAAALDRLRGRDHRPGEGEGERLVAAIGPCIGACCFEVGRDVGEEIARAAAEARVIGSERGEKVYVDLRAAVRAQLVAGGVSDGRIDDVPGCTKHEAARFHSFRRDGAHSGRMLAAIATRPRRA